MSEGGGEFDPFEGKKTEAPEHKGRSRIKTVVIIAAAVIGGLFVVGFALAGFAGSMYGNYTPVASNIGDQVYVNKDYNFQMQYPAGWSVNEGATLKNMDGSLADLEGMSYIVAFGGPRVSGYTVNLNVVTESMRGYSFDEYVSAARDMLPQTLSMNSFRLLQDTAFQTQIQGRPVHEFQYVANIDGIQTKVASIIVEDKGNALIMSYAAPSSNYDQYHDVALRSMASIHFLT